MREKTLIQFLHIPKTGGLTIAHSLLPRLYPKNEVFTTQFTRMVKRTEGRGVGIFDRALKAAGLFSGMRKADDIWYPHSLEQAREHWERLPDGRRAGIRLIHGTHIEYGIGETLSLPVATFTMLREPVNRALSHYYFSKEKRLPPDDPGLPGHMTDHVEANLQTRLLAGPQDMDALLPPGEMLARARQNLRACAAVGLTERFDESLLLYQKAFGWRRPYYRIQNVGRTRPPKEAMPAEILRGIEDENRLDAALYETARELFEAGVRGYGPNFKRDLRRFRTGLRWWRAGVETRDGFKMVPKLIAKYVTDPMYEAIAKWGGFRILVPARLKPRVERNLEDGRLYFDLKMGRLLIGSFDHVRQAWDIRRPFHWLLDERALPFAGGLGKR